MKKSIPIIDLFAGPGGLGEGFSSLKQSSGKPVFSIKVSIEKDPIAHQTLSLRAIYRHLGTQIPDSYYDRIRGNISRDDFEKIKEIKDVAKLAKQEARCAILGREEGFTPNAEIDQWIKEGLQGETEWVLIGGPPCQAYSLAGRSRMKGANPCTFEQDHRHFLYKEYLRIIQKHKPAVFVMENVKGILSSTHAGSLIFEKIMNDLSSPGDGAKYELRSFVVESVAGKNLSPKDFIIKAENYGIPQARHRVILLGIREDLSKQVTRTLSRQEELATVEQTIAGLPRIRSTISRQYDSPEKWHGYLQDTLTNVKLWLDPARSDVINIMQVAIDRAAKHTSSGDKFIRTVPDFSNMPQHLRKWLQDDRLGGIIQHASRGHMPLDLQRYLFAASYAEKNRVSPKVRQFPNLLLPKHKNIHEDTVPFEDRFRVQLKDSPSTTVVSHISKDGHYYIHYDPSQCRSLTVREAARLQTFPDNYFFEGNRTQQYVQVGNAVPPLLAKQLAEIVARLFG